MIPRSVMLTVVGMLLLAPQGACQPRTYRAADYEYRVVPVVSGLEHPWSIAFLPGGGLN